MTLAEKRELAARLLRKRSVNVDIHPASHMQRSLYLHHRLHPRSTAYHVAYAMRIQSRLDSAALRRAFEAIVDRRDSLRSTFFVDPTSGELMERTHGHRPLSFQIIAVPGIEESALHDAVEQAAASPFDLESGPLFRVHIFERSQCDAVLLITAHHTVIDGWSLILLLDELRLLYAAERDGLPAQLNRITTQYAEFTTWQKQLIDSPEGEDLRKYWRDELEGDVPVLDLPCDRVRPQVETSCGASHRFAIPSALHGKLRELARSEQTTVFNLLLAAWSLLVARHARQNEVVIGVPSAGRTRAEFEQLIGCLINMVPIRIPVPREFTFREFLGTVRERSGSAFAHAGYPFQLIVEELLPSRDRSRPPVFQTSFVFQNLQRAAGLSDLFDRHARGEPADFAGLTAARFPVRQQEGQLEISLELFETASTLQGICRYSTDLFDDESIVRLVDRFEVLLENIAAAPEAPVARIPILTPREHHQLTMEWAWGPLRQWPFQSLPELLDEWGRRTPDRVAIEYGTQRITYREFAERSDSLASVLRKRGIGAGDVVGISLNRSPYMLVALVGVMKAGAAYLPLDPAFPADRLAFMRSDSGVSLIVTEHSTDADSFITGVDRIFIDDVAGAPDEPFEYSISPEQLAYLIYTSGSTGQPKGVEILHGGLANFIPAQQLMLSLTASDRVLQLASFSFDGSLLEYAMAFGVGATVVLADAEDLRPGIPLVDTMRRLSITAAFIQPSTMSVLPEADLPALQLLCIGGDACSEELMNRWAPGRRFFHLYGPTEVSVWNLGVQCFAGEGKPPIGRPIANTSTYILDDAMQPVPRGVAGELYIGGAGVGRGYRNRGDLTSQRFVPNPFAGGMLYRSGDLVRWRADSNIEFLGRTDRQVKLRGFRVEPEEIESILKVVPGVRDAVVVARQGQLAGYLVMDTPSPDLDPVRAYLVERLPGYMRPATLTALTAFPLTPGGKIDRAALPDPLADVPYQPPRNELERVLCECFGEVLEHTPYGIHDDFFEFGGHSLIATRLVARLRESVHEEVTLRMLFEEPTPARLAAALKGDEPATLPLPPLEAGPRVASPPLSFAQERLWFIHQLEPSSPAFNIPAALRIHGPVNVGAVERAINTIVNRHDVLRARFFVEDGRSAQAIADCAELHIEPVANDLHRVAERDAFTPFNLAEGRLIRAALVRESEDRHVLIVTMHHIVSDGWSMGIFLWEFSELYQAFSARLEPALAPLPVQYADFARWQRSWLRGEVLNQQLGWWKTHLTDLTPIELPSAAARSQTHSGRAGTHAFRLEPYLVAMLKSFSREHGATLYMALLAAFHEMLGRYTGSSDVVCGSPVANRNHAGTRELIGFFVNMLVMRADLSDDPSLRQLLERERAFALGALANQDIPFETLVDALQPQRDLTRTPFFQVTFALHNVPMQLPQISGLRLEPADDIARTARYELEFHLSESASGSIDGYAIYARDLFAADFIGCFVEQFQTLLALAIREPDRALRDLDVLSSQKREHTLRIANALGPATVYPTSCLHRLVESQAKRRPEAPAVRYEGLTVTYSDLNQRADRVASLLRARGVRSGDLVGLLAGRSHHLVAGMLGILKAGAGYVPLDPAYPQERLDFIIEDAGVTTVLTGSDIAQCETSAIDDAAVDETTPADVAYVIYTSGSTGRPKGVPITHANVTRIFPATSEWFHFGERDVWTLFHSSAFDFSVWEIWGALVHGGCLVVVPYETSRSPEAFSRLLAEERVTVLNQTPSAFRQLQHVMLSGPPLPPELRLIIFGGEALDFRSLAPWFQRFGDERPQLVNMYGITETTIHVTFRPVTAADARRGGSLIGRPLPDLRLYLLDSRQRLVPMGTIGEICVGGAGVSSGYLNRPELTSERFINDPFHPGERLYRSGDLGRATAEGDIEYLGRLDHQVQLHGFRIELGEIEAALLGSEMVRDAVARMRDERIIAWVVPAGEEPLNTSTLRAHLGTRLPGYMIPSAFVSMAELPLNHNGKIDTAALPDPGADRPGMSSDFATPATEEERILAAVWSEVLGIEKVGVHDNFFELGGDSILSIRVISKAAQAGLTLTPKLLFQHQTIAQLARVATRAAAPTEIDQAPVTGAFPLTPIQRWFVAQRLADAHHWNQSVVLAIDDEIPDDRLEDALRQLLVHHDVLRMRLVNGSAEIGSPRDEVPFSSIDISTAPDPEAEFQRHSSSLQASLDLEQGPIVRLARFRMGRGEPGRLVLIVHHLAVDGVSWRILIEDLNALVKGEALPPKTVSFLAWAERARELPDFPVPAAFDENVESTAETVTVALTSAETSDLLHRLPMIAEARVEEALLNAVASVLGERSVHLEGHGRDLLGLNTTRTAGWFTTLTTRTLGGALSSDSPETSFNYLGQFDQQSSGGPLRLTSIRAGLERSPKARRAHRLDISAAVFEGCLQVAWTFSSALDTRAAIERQAKGFIGALRAHIQEQVHNGIPANARDVYRLAPQQQGMLLESLGARGTGVHVEQLTCVLEGNLNVERFKQAWRAVIARHTALRTAFAWRGRTRPVQVVFDEAEPTFETGSWTFDDVDAYLSAEQHHGFELDHAPLVRFGLFELAHDRHRFVWTQSHTVLDGWCQPLVLGEVLRHYRGGFVDGAPPRYRDYIGYLARQDHGAAEAYWRRYLKGFAEPTPVGRITSVPSPAGGYETVEVALKEHASRQLEAASTANRVTVGTTILAAWSLILARVSGAGDVLFGMTVAGRPPDLAGGDQMIGLLSNTLPMRTFVNPVEQVWPWLRQIGESNAEMRSFETSPGGLIRRSAELHPATPLHDSVVVVENYPAGQLERETEGTGLAIGDIAFCGARTQQAVALLAVPGRRLSLRFVFDRQRITPGTLAKQFAALLEALAAAPSECTIGELLEAIPAGDGPLYHPASRVHGNSDREMTAEEARLAALWRDLLQVPEPGVHDNFFELGGHSLVAIDLLARIKSEFGQDLPLSALIETPTIASLAARLGNESQARRSPLVGINASGDRTPLVLLPGAGGNVLYFQPLAQQLGNDQPLFAIETQELLTDVEEIAAFNCGLVNERFPDQPYTLGGHSFGCMVALEMALQLERQGRHVPALVILDDMAPVAGRIAPDDLHLDIDAIWLYKILMLAARLQRREIDITLDELFHMDRDDQLDRAMHLLQQIDYLPANISREHAHRYVETFKINFRASFRYIAKERYRGRVMLFRASNPQPDDPIVAYSSQYIDDPAWGWGHVAERVDVHWVPGDHISMMIDPNAAQLAKEITASLLGLPVED